MFTEAPAATAPKTDSSHWYSQEGGQWHPLYTPEKNYTLREARKDKEAGHTVVPSVTTVMKVLHKQNLVDYLMVQTAKAALETPVTSTDAEWIDLVVSKANNASKGAMDLGTRIHRAMEQVAGGLEYEADINVYVKPVLEARDDLDVVTTGVEECCGSTKYGYAGKCDEHAMGMTILDYKSRKSTGKTPKVGAYSTDKMQLAAYGFAIFGNPFFATGRGIIMGISTSQPGVVTPHVFTGEELKPAFSAFIALCDVWRFENKFDPRVT
jgi:hypothetical protein